MLTSENGVVGRWAGDRQRWACIARRRSADHTRRMPRGLLPGVGRRPDRAPRTARTALAIFARTDVLIFEVLCAGAVVISAGRSLSRPAWRPYVLLDGDGVRVDTYAAFPAAHRQAHDPATLAVHPFPLLLINVPGLRFWKIDDRGCVQLQPGAVNPEWRCSLTARGRVKKGRGDG